jgi:hypothetical protein
MGELFMSKEQIAAKDDAICRGYGAKPGTDVYIQCRVAQDQRRDAVRNEPDAPINPPPTAAGAAPTPGILPQQTHCQSMAAGMGTVQTVCR